MNGKNILAIYSKNVSEVIHPVSDFPIPQPDGADLTRVAGILSYLNIVRGGAHFPKAS